MRISSPPDTHGYQRSISPATSDEPGGDRCPFFNLDLKSGLDWLEIQTMGN
ncbi:hypothetical protein NIES39_M01720 [Arthrospira platensis NIES-39]|nr:hypothetical protein NIES39_M01720 [Arthrospira platensis NIES-39]